MSYINKKYWNDFYKIQRNLNENSTFSEFVFEKIENNSKKYLIVDLGCGTGKDSFYFSAKGISVVGIDGAEEVIKINKDKISGSKKNLIDFKCVDLSNKAEVRQILKGLNELAKNSSKEIILYNRFFLHAIPEEVEDMLFSEIEKNISVPYFIMAEFRTKEDEKLEKTYNNHYRRYIDTDLFLKKVLDLEWSVWELLKGRGLSIYKSEDPYLGRMIIRNDK
ncbi:MAG: class I SAM-dependent methyltransferase [Solibacillus sp.]|uniref:class I SAM-dependent methyltransferase n=1 Tax=Solibacillus sp. TaxID=1909654 RepID=UPI003315F9D6